MQGISNRNTHDFQKQKEQNQEFFNKHLLEEKVVKRITESLVKRLIGWNNIDDKLTNDELVKRWLTVICVLGRNNQDINKTAWEIYNKKVFPYFDFASIEDARALSKLVEERFLEEVWAYTVFQRDSESSFEEEIMENIDENLANVNNGDLRL